MLSSRTLLTLLCGLNVANTIAAPAAIQYGPELSEDLEAVDLEKRGPTLAVAIFAGVTVAGTAFTFQEWDLVGQRCNYSNPNSGFTSCIGAEIGLGIGVAMTLSSIGLGIGAFFIPSTRKRAMEQYMELNGVRLRADLSDEKVHNALALHNTSFDSPGRFKHYNEHLDVMAENHYWWDAKRGKLGVSTKNLYGGSETSLEKRQSATEEAFIFTDVVDSTYYNEGAMTQYLGIDAGFFLTNYMAAQNLGGVCAKLNDLSGPEVGVYEILPGSSTATPNAGLECASATYGTTAIATATNTYASGDPVLPTLTGGSIAESTDTNAPKPITTRVSTTKASPTPTCIDPRYGCGN